MKQFFLFFLVLLLCFYGCADEGSPSSNDPVNNPPTTPTNPYPSDSAVNIDDSTALLLTWESTDPDINDTLRFDLFAGTSLPLSDIPLASNMTTASYNMGLLVPGVTYFWKITAKDNHGAASSGNTWRFTIRTRP